MKDIVDSIPQILLYIIPGFISVRIKEFWSKEKKHDQFSNTLLCVLYSFVSIIIYKIIRYLANLLWPQLYDIINKETAQICICIVLGIILGVAITKLPKSRLGRLFGQHMDSHHNTESSVWHYTLKNDHGAWAKVFLRNGMVYLGYLQYYTVDPDEEIQEVALYHFTVHIRNEGKIDYPDDFLLTIEDENETGEQDKVLIKRDDIISIQVYGGLDKKLEEEALQLLNEVLYEKEQNYVKVPAVWREKADTLHYEPQSIEEKWIEERLGSWQYEKRKDAANNKYYILKMYNGRVDRSKVLAIIAFHEEQLLVAAYAEEKLFRYNSAEKIVKEISQRIPRKGK